MDRDIEFIQSSDKHIDETEMTNELREMLGKLKDNFPFIKGLVCAYEMDDPVDPVNKGIINVGMVGSNAAIKRIMNALIQSFMRHELAGDSARRDSNEQRNDDESDDQESEKGWDDPTQF